MTTILFIHGTGSRDPEAKETFERIRASFRAAGSAARLERCYWGAAHGARRKDKDGYLSKEEFEALSSGAKADPDASSPSGDHVSAPSGDQKGSTSNPINMAFVPSADSQKVLASGEPLAKLLQDATNLNFKVSVPTSYTTVGMCSTCVSSATPKISVWITGMTSMKNSVEGWRLMWENSLTRMASNPHIGRALSPLERPGSLLPESGVGTVDSGGR